MVFYKFAIKSLCGKTFIFYNIDAGDTIAQVKEKIEKSNGLSKAHLRLLYNSKNMEDDTFVRDYNITDETIIPYWMSNDPVLVAPKKSK